MKRLLHVLAATIALGLALAAPVLAQTDRQQANLTTTGAVPATGILQVGAGIYDAITVQLAGTWSATVQFEQSPDGGTTWITKTMFPVGGGAGVTSTAGNGTWKAAGGGMSLFRVRVSAYTSGTVGVTILQTPALDVVAVPDVANRLPSTTGQAAMAGSLPVVVASDQTAVSIAQPSTLRVSAAQTVTASSAYASGNVVGGKITFSNAVRVGGGGGVIQTCLLRDKAGQNVNYDLFLLDADPTATTITDKTAVAINTADLAKVVAPPISFSGIALAAASTMGVIGNGGLGYAFKLTSGTTLYGILVTRGAPTYASTSDVSVDCTILPD